MQPHANEPAAGSNSTIAPGSAHVTNESFQFELPATVTEADYLAQEALSRPRSLKARVYLVGFTVLGLVALSSLRTAAVGAVVLAVSLFTWTSPRWSRWSARKTYSWTKYLHGPLTYGLSDQKLWFRGGDLYSESTWAGLAVWEEADGVLRLSAHGMPALRFPIAELRAVGVYDQIRKRLKDHGVEFDSPEHRRMY